MKRLQSGLLSAIVAATLVQIPTATPASPESGLTPLQASEIATSYQNLTTEYYKKVDPQDVLDSVRDELDAALKHAGAKGSVPAIHSSSPSANVRSIDAEITSAERIAGSKMSSTDLTYVAMSGILDSVHDRYTVFLDPAHFAALNQDLDPADFGGTGIVIQQDDANSYIDVSNVVPDGPADKAGVQPDDVLTAIDGTSTKGMKMDVASSHLRGKEGTTVSLSIQRAGKPLPAPVVITRAKIHQLSVFEKMLPNKIGYLALSVFAQTTGQEVDAALARLQARGARAIIMDLRENGGGYLEAAIAVSSKFISSGPIVSIESRASDITTREADDTAISPVPLAVIVNGHTASASEITAGAIQDTGVGAIIGTQTFGKGVVQSIFRLPDHSAIKITTARYLTPNNRDINHLGIKPDIIIAPNKGDRFGDPARDVQLKRAMDYIDDRMARLDTTSGGT